MRPLAAALALALAACGEPETTAPRAAAPAAHAALDCGKGFEALSAEIPALPDLVQAPSPGEPYRFLNHKSGNPSYVITLPEAPAHPAILMQASAGGAMRNSGCRWGDAAAYDELVGYIDGLRAARR